MTKEEESILELLEKEKLLGYIFATDVYKSIEELLEKRKFLYQISADYIIDINEHTNIYETVDKIKEAYIIS